MNPNFPSAREEIGDSQEAVMQLLIGRGGVWQMKRNGTGHLSQSQWFSQHIPALALKGRTAPIIPLVARYEVCAIFSNQYGPEPYKLFDIYRVTKASTLMYLPLKPAPGMNQTIIEEQLNKHAHEPKPRTNQPADNKSRGSGESLKKKRTQPKRVGRKTE